MAGMGLLRNPLQELPERRTAMAVVGFLFRAEFGESFLNFGEVKQRIISKSICSLRLIQNQTFSLAMKNPHGFAAACRSNYADEPPSAFLKRNVFDFADQPPVIRLVVSIAIRLGWIVGCITGRMYTGRAVQDIHFQSGVVGQEEFTPRIPAVAFGFLARVFFKCQPVFDYGC